MTVVVASEPMALDSGLGPSCCHPGGGIQSGMPGLIKPSWAIEATSVPSVAWSVPRASPRPP
jgi:hypothetical protein